MRYIRSAIVALSVLAVASATTLVAQDEGDPGVPCFLACAEAAAEAMNQCREDGGSILECVGASAEALASCREDAGCDDGIIVLPEICGMDCFQSARAASSQCREDGGSFWDCLRAYFDAVGACRDEAGCERPDLPDLPEPCGIECFDGAKSAFRDCRDGDGSLRECAESFIAELSACREAAGCGEVDEDEGEEQVAALMATEARFRRGDVNDDAAVNVSDPIELLGYLFQSKAAPDCGDAADANDDGRIDISDATTILITLFLGTRELPAPADGLGFDPTPDGLGCLD